jgi:hypothetical protein
VPAGGGGSRIAGPGPYRWGRREPDWSRSGRRAWSRTRRGVRTDLVRGRSALATPSPRTMSPCVGSSSRIAILTENQGLEVDDLLAGVLDLPDHAHPRGPARGQDRLQRRIGSLAQPVVGLVGDRVGQLVR